MVGRAANRTGGSKMSDDKDSTKKELYATILASIVEEKGGEVVFEINDKFIENPFSLFYKLEKDNSTQKCHVIMKLSCEENMQ
jgi:hypothetical protein